MALPPQLRNLPRRELQAIRRSLPRVRRPPRLPRPLPPDSLAAEYANAARAVVDAWVRDVFAALGAVDDVIRAPLRRQDVRVNPDWRKRIQLITQERFRSGDVDALVNRVGNAVVRRPEQRGDWIDRVARISSVAQVTTETQAIAWKREQIERIVTLGDDAVKKITPIVSDAIDRGLDTDALRKEIEKATDATRWQAERIARDQVLTFNARIRETRQRALGVEEFIWRTSRDARVRQSHEEIDGNKYRYDDPPVVDDEPSLPGEPILCRCTAEAVVPSDLAELFE